MVGSAGSSLLVLEQLRCYRLRDWIGQSLFGLVKRETITVKRLYEFVTKTNQVLLFLVLIGGPVLLAYSFFEHQHYEPPQVAVAQSPEEAKESVVKDVQFLGQSSGFYVFGILKGVVTNVRKPLFVSVSYLGTEPTGVEVVNVAFSKGEQRIKTLLPNDGLVLSYNLGTDNRPEKIKALLFNCVTEDTDGNHKLDGNDRNDLYIVSEDLDKPDLVVRGVSQFQIISPTHLMVKTQEKDLPQFWDIDTETSTKKEVLWK